MPNFTDVFPGTHVTSWTDDEGFDMVTIGVPGTEVSVLWVGEYDHVLTVWDALEGAIAPRVGDPLFDALEAHLDRLATQETTPPPIQQTLPGRSRPYRLYTVEHCGYEYFAGKASTVTNTRWGVSYSNTYGEDGWTLNVYDVSGMPEEGIEYHPLNGTRYTTKEEANRAAFEAGVLAFMVYVEPPTT